MEDWAGSGQAPTSDDDEAVAVMGADWRPFTSVLSERADLVEEAGCRGLPRGAGPLPAGMASGGSAVCCKDSVDDLSGDITLPCEATPTTRCSHRNCNTERVSTCQIGEKVWLDADGGRGRGGGKQANSGDFSPWQEWHDAGSLGRCAG